MGKGIWGSWSMRTRARLAVVSCIVGMPTANLPSLNLIFYKCIDQCQGGTRRKGKDVPQNFSREIMESSNFLSSSFNHLLFLHSPQMCVTPTELIHAQRRVDGQEETVHWVPLRSTTSISEPRIQRVYSRRKIADHPTHTDELSLDDEDKSLHGTSASIHTHEKKQEDVPVSPKCSKHDTASEAEQKLRLRQL